MFCSVWNTWLCRFGLVDLACFSFIEVLFIFQGVFIFVFVFIIQVISSSYLRLSFYLKSSFNLRSSSYLMSSSYLRSSPYMCGFSQPRQKFALNCYFVFIFISYPVQKKIWNLLCISFGRVRNQIFNLKENNNLRMGH